jgi:hypothetical protein
MWIRNDVQFLEEIFIEEEFNRLIVNMQSEYSLGLDGLIRKFFENFWNIIKEDLKQAIQFFYNTSSTL